MQNTCWVIISVRYLTFYFLSNIDRMRQYLMIFLSKCASLKINYYQIISSCAKQGSTMFSVGKRLLTEMSIINTILADDKKISPCFKQVLYIEWSVLPSMDCEWFPKCDYSHFVVQCQQLISLTNTIVTYNTVPSKGDYCRVVCNGSSVLTFYELLMNCFILSQLKTTNTSST